MKKKRKYSSTKRIDLWLESTYEQSSISTIHKLVTKPSVSRELSKSEIASLHLKLAMGLANASQIEYDQLIRIVDNASRTRLSGIELPAKKDTGALGEKQAASTSRQLLQQHRPK